MNWQWDSTVILWVQLLFQLYPSNLKCWPEKNYWFWNSRWWILEVTFFFGIENNKLYSCIRKHCANRPVTYFTYLTLWSYFLRRNIYFSAKYQFLVCCIALLTSSFAHWKLAVASSFINLVGITLQSIMI